MSMVWANGSIPNFSDDTKSYLSSLIKTTEVPKSSNRSSTITLELFPISVQILLAENGNYITVFDDLIILHSSCTAIQDDGANPLSVTIRAP
jgi:hypothetical protein